MKHLFLITVALALTNPLSAQRFQPTGERKTILVDGVERAYRIHVPATIESAKSPAALVFCLHGGGGNAELASVMGWTPRAEKEGFLVVYPEALNKHWNDGRESKKFAEQDAKTDDVAFLVALLDHLESKFSIDPKRIFTTGPSNGGFMSQRLAIEVSDRFAAAGVIIAGIPMPYLSGKKPFDPTEPISILMMNGTDDPLVPYEGGPITADFTPRIKKPEPVENERGATSSTDEAVALWRKHNGLEEAPVETENIPDKDKSDGCTVEKSSWSGGKNGTSVVLYKVIGGGHTWPGGAQYLPERIIGKTCRDFDGLDAIWDFFKAHPKP